jgi:hypothetical protein
LVTLAESSVAAPDVLTVDREVLPVTPSVPPTVALLVTLAELRVAAPDVLTVDRLVFPVTPRVPPTVALPVLLSVVELTVVAVTVSTPLILFAPLAPLLRLMVPELAPPVRVLSPVTVRSANVSADTGVVNRIFTTTRAMNKRGRFRRSLLLTG